ncbi:hypothetical protein [Desulfobacter postgatei]|uniref:hypothetical protein n=1 Tax=Desulfobacter postgatei TaxID=2293 RepID=UPI00259B73BE|nr:hypothetical protein [uncultured Desulfobacter sp.]
MIDKEYVINKKKKALQAVHDFNSDEQNRAFLKSEKKREEPGYNGSTFLYIRAFDGDRGARPISAGTVFWLSPDIELYQAGVLVDTSKPLAANTTYSVRVTVTNDGDLDCNVCTVDLFLCKPSIGSSVNSALVVGVANTPVLEHSTATIEIPFTTTEDMEGHRCMFARAYSLVNHDYPADLINFVTSSDRQIGQQNLDIVSQGSTYLFNVNILHNKPIQDMEITLKKDASFLRKNRVLKEKYSLSKKPFKAEYFKFEKLGIAKYNEGAVAIPLKRFRKNPLIVTGFEKEVKHFKNGIWHHQFQPGLNEMKLDIPVLGLTENEAVPMNISVRDPETGIIIGGITIFIVERSRSRGGKPQSRVYS